jgi:hypothetical protein
MKKIQDLLKKYKLPMIWTGGYVFVMWAILYFLFNFNIFNGTQWRYLAHAHLHGFAGFTFGLLILAAIPLYVATTVLVARKQEMLITLPKIPVPCFKPAADADKKSEAPEEQPKPNSDNIEISPDVPFEIQSNYIRALKKLDLIQISQTQPESDDANTASSTTESDEIMPLPSDFDISFDDTPTTTDEVPAAFPVFKDLNFDTVSESPAPDTDTNTPDTHARNNDSVINFLKQQNKEFSIQDDVVITPPYAIITHSDTDFWVTDTDNWFATGKSIPSPIQAVKSVAEQQKLKPVLYLESQNILDLENLIPQWESDGIIVVTDLNNL